MKQLIINNKNTPMTTSMIVAEAFGKEHKNVLRDIENLECSEEFTKLNFEPSEYKGRNGMNKFYFIRQDGFAFLVMGYTGRPAAKFKEAFIMAFNIMSEELKKQSNTPVPILQTYQRRIFSEAAKECPSNRWCVFSQASKVMLLIDKYVGSVCEFDLVDGSIGKMWVAFRQGKSWAKTVTQYHHHFMDKRGKQLSNCYDFTELEHFHVWLDKIYCTGQLHEYLHNKFKKDVEMLGRVKAFKQKLLGSGSSKAA